MLVLSLDTTTRMGSCAIARDGHLEREEPTDPTRDHAAQLPGALAALLQRARLALADVDLFAVAAGPGSFTGLRIGIASMQGLAAATGKPLIGVSALEALADHANGGRVAAWMDAWRGEVYAALYDAGREVDPPIVAHPNELIDRLCAKPTLFIGDGAAAYSNVIRERCSTRATFADPVTPLLAGTIARLAEAAARAGHLPPPEAIRPVYVRRPDAELARQAPRP